VSGKDDTMKKQKTTQTKTNDKKQNATTAEGSAKTSKSEEHNNTTKTGAALPMGPYLGSKSLDKEIRDFCRRSDMREKNSYQMAYEQGDDIRRMVLLLEGNQYRHLKRRPNGGDPYATLCGHPESRMGAKQMRRYVLFADTVDAIRAAKYEAPILGLTYYVEAARLKSVESIIETLNQVVKDDLSVRELIGIVDQIMPPKKKAMVGSSEDSDGDENDGTDGIGKTNDWKNSLEKIIGETIARLAPIAQEMSDKKATLDKETADSLRKLQEKIQEILRRVA
jgi:hypothetical protein